MINSAPHAYTAESSQPVLYCVRRLPPNSQILLVTAMAPTIGAVSGSIGVCLVADLRGLRICWEFEGLGTLLPCELPPLSPAQTASFAVVENHPGGMEEARDSTGTPVPLVSWARKAAVQAFT